MRTTRDYADSVPRVRMSAAQSESAVMGWCAPVGVLRRGNAAAGQPGRHDRTWKQTVQNRHSAGFRTVLPKARPAGGCR
jgi:hypothetical protein